MDLALLEWLIDMPAEIRAGPVNFVVTNEGSEAHSLVIEGNGSSSSCQRRWIPVSRASSRPICRQANTSSIARSATASIETRGWRRLTVAP